MVSGVFRAPDYALRWSPRILREQVERLIWCGDEFDTDEFVSDGASWRRQVETLVRQPCTSAMPHDALARRGPWLSASCADLDYDVPEGLGRQLSWLAELAGTVDHLLGVRKPAPVGRRRLAGRVVTPVPSLTDAACQVRQLLQTLHDEYYRAKYLGFACVDGNADLVLALQRSSSVEVVGTSVELGPDDGKRE